MESEELIIYNLIKNIEFSKYLDDQYEVVACVGHVKDLPRGSLGVDVDNDFQMELVILDDKKDFFKNSHLQNIPVKSFYQVSFRQTVCTSKTVFFQK